MAGKSFPAIRRSRQLFSFNGVDSEGKARLLAGGAVFVEEVLFYGLVELGEKFLGFFLRFGCILFGDETVGFAHLGAECRENADIAFAASFVDADFLDR